MTYTPVDRIVFWSESIMIIYELAMGNACNQKECGFKLLFG